MNPELRRSLWLQLSPQRLIAAPVILGSIYLLIVLVEIVPPSGAAEIYRWGLILTLALWGARRAADAVAEEVAGGTWDAQRMSAIGAWAMSWGKLLGSTSFVWYCGLVWLVLYLASIPGFLAEGAIVRDLAVLLGTAVLGQAVALGASLVFLRKAPGTRRLPVTLSQTLGLLVIFAVPFASFFSDAWRSIAEGRWFGVPVDSASFGLASLAVFILWALLGIYRLMRLELQFRSYPWAWIAFTLFLMAYATGFQYEGLVRLEAATPAWLFAPLSVGILLVYAVLFAEPKDVVRYRWFFAALRRGAGARALVLMPLWLPTYLIVVVLAMALVLLVGDISIGVPMAFLQFDIAPAPLVVAVLLFIARDIGFVLFLNFGDRRRRADLAAFLYLLVLYGPVAAIVQLLGLTWLQPFLTPVPMAHPAATIVPPLIEAVAVAGLLWWTLASASRQLRPAAAAA